MRGCVDVGASRGATPCVEPDARMNKHYYNATWTSRRDSLPRRAGKAEKHAEKFNCRRMFYACANLCTNLRVNPVEASSNLALR